MAEQSRQTVMFGGDLVVIERTPAGLVAASIPARREVYGTRSEVEALINVLRSAIRERGVLS